MAYIMVDRKLFSHWIWNDEPFSKGQAWIDLICLANYENKKLPYKGEVVVCKRGDVNLSMTYLANRWKWSRKRVKKFLELLEDDGMVTTKVSTHRTVITIVNYGKYQGKDTARVATKVTTKAQQGYQQGYSKGSITNKVKKDKEREEIYMPPADDDDDEGMSPEELMDKIRRGVLYDE